MIKTCVSSYGFGYYNNESQLGVLGVVEKAAQMGIDAMEFTESEYTALEKAPELRAKCEEVGITPVAFCVGASFSTGDSAKLKDEIKRVQGLCDVAKAMGVSMLRHDIAYGPIECGRPTSYERSIPQLAAAVTEVTKYAEQLGIRTMTENHGFFSQDALRVEKLVCAVDHPNFGALVDIGNFMCADEDPVRSVGIMAPYAFHVHCKDFYFRSGMEIDPGEGWLITRGGNKLRGCTLGFGNAKAAQSIGILKRSGYDGYMSVEYEGGEDALWGIRVSLDNLKRFIEMG